MKIKNKTHQSCTFIINKDLYQKRTIFDSRPIRINIHTIYLGRFLKKIQNGKLKRSFGTLFRCTRVIKFLLLNPPF